MKPAQRTINRWYSAEQVRQSIRLTWSQSPLFTPSFPTWVPLVHGTRITALDAPAGGFDNAGEDPPDAIRSDTSELTWSGMKDKRGLVTINTDRSQSLIGSCKSGDGIGNVIGAWTTTSARSR